MARKILLADDSVTAQNMGRRILVEAGYEVITVNNGSAALKKIAELNPDLIILDVYMPGYNGLEVCQRIKAAPETAAIPVLLTVGKLEPFKPDEAKKVFADSFIIKPFEATELINALTKLEDMIVPQPVSKAAPAQSVSAQNVPAKSAPAPVKEAAKKSQPQEDPDWKDRLRIQPANVKAEEVKAPPLPEVVPPPAATQFHDIRHEIAAAETDEALAQSLPANATSEELAAITAAVSAFADQEDAAEAEEIPQEQSAGFQEVQPYTPEHEAPQEVSSAAIYGEIVPAEEAAQEDEQEEDDSLHAISPWANPQLLEEVAAALDQPHTELVPAQEVAAVAPATPVDGFTETEVDAALAALGADDIMSRLHAEEQAHVRSLDYVDAQAAAAWSQEPTAIGSTKWIAQEMRLEENEASLILEEEMQRAHAALRAEEEARTAAMLAQVVEESAPVAEAPVQEVAPVDAVSQIEVPVSEIEEVASVAAESEPTAYAAAAGASANSSTAYVDSPASPSVEEQPSQPESRQEDPELAAAWARWRQIRESVASPQFVSQVADVAAAELQSTQQQTPSNGSKPDAAPSADAIASIVDSVLAQLKPKLVEEIAKQLSEKK